MKNRPGGNKIQLHTDSGGIMAISHIYDRVVDVKTHQTGSRCIHEMILQDGKSVFTPPGHNPDGMRPIPGNLVLVNMEIGWVTVFELDCLFIRGFPWFPTLNRASDL